MLIERCESESEASCRSHGTDAFLRILQDPLQLKFVQGIYDGYFDGRDYHFNSSAAFGGRIQLRTFASSWPE